LFAKDDASSLMFTAIQHIMRKQAEERAAKRAAEEMQTTIDFTPHDNTADMA
jgi:histone H3/H4